MPGRILPKQIGKGKDPYYYFQRSYRVRDAKGSSRVKTESVYLGTADKILHELKEGQRPQRIPVKSFGAEAASLEIARELDIAGIIDRHVPKRNQGHSVGEYILVGILNKVCHSTSRAGIADWIKKTILPEKMKVDPELLKSQNFWDAFDKIIPEKDLKERKERLKRGEIEEKDLFNEEKILAIETDIWKKVAENYHISLDVLLYDPTNFFTFIDHSNTRTDLPRCSKSNKQGRYHLRQVNLALCASREGGLPLMHVLYRGNLHEAKLFPESLTKMVNRFSRLGKDARNITLVFDKGNNSEENIQMAKDLDFHIVGSLTPSQHEDLMRVHLKDYTEEYDGLRVYRTSKDVYGIKAEIVITYNASLARKQEMALERGIQKLKAEYKEAFRKNKNKSRKKIESALEKVAYGNQYKRFLRVEIKGRRYKNLKVTVDRKERNKKRRTFGKLIIFTDKRKIETGTLIEEYHSKHVLERDFSEVKSPDLIRFQPMYVWTDTKIQVYGLICVLALLILRLMAYKADRAGLKMSTRVLLTELRDIKEVILVYSPQRVIREIAEMSTIQQRLFEIFNLSKYAPDSS